MQPAGLRHRRDDHKAERAAVSRIASERTHLSSSSRRVLVWDAPTRLFHWLIVALVVTAYLTWRLDWMDWHAKTGDAVLTLVVFRVLWGFFGSETARFPRFLTSPAAAVRHLTHALHREPDRQVGHNPAGGWMVLVLLALLLIETLSGIYVLNDVANEGPLTELTPAWIANAITAMHLDFLGRAPRRRRATRCGDRGLRGGQAAQPARAHDHRLQNLAGRRAAAAHGVCHARRPAARLQRPRRSRSRLPGMSDQPFGGIT